MCGCLPIITTQMDAILWMSYDVYDSDGCYYVDVLLVGRSPIDLKINLLYLGFSGRKPISVMVERVTINTF